MQNSRLGLLLAAIVCSGTTAAGDPLILSCKFIDGSQGGRHAAGVNQIAIDRDVPSIEFRAAETIGTENPVNYSFVNARRTMINPQGDTLVIQRHPLAIAAGGVRFGSPFAIRFNETNQTLVWQYIDGDIPEFARFKCRY